VRLMHRLCFHFYWFYAKQLTSITGRLLNSLTAPLAAQSALEEAMFSGADDTEVSGGSTECSFPC
jgi:hypothetical protein